MRNASSNNSKHNQGKETSRGDCRDRQTHPRYPLSIVRILFIVNRLSVKNKGKKAIAPAMAPATIASDRLSRNTGVLTFLLTPHRTVPPNIGDYCTKANR